MTVSLPVKRQKLKQRSRKRTRVRVRAVSAKGRRDGIFARLVRGRDADTETDLTARLVIEVDRVRRSDVHEEDEVDDLAGDEARVPCLESASRDAEEVDLFRDADDQIELGQARESRLVAFLNEGLEVAAWPGRWKRISPNRC